MSALLSPVSGRPLAADTSHSLADGTGERWPVVDGIAYLRTNRAGLVAATLEDLDAGRREVALARLLADQDDWWPGPDADPARLARLAREHAGLTLRAAMEHLGFGRVGDYIAHRWSDPTYLAGLALLEAHWRRPAHAFELACGTGPYLRELARRGVACLGGDVVFAKLWLARHWIVDPSVDLVCFDAASPWPVAGRRFDLVFCHDAFYFLEPKAAVATALSAATADGGVLALAHIHNRAYPNHSAGAALDADALGELFPQALAYDDCELTRALAEARAPRPRALEALTDVEAFSLVVGDAAPPRPASGGLTLPPTGATLVQNPLYGEEGRIVWPSERYRDEYAARATYPARSAAPSPTRLSTETDTAARSRELVDLPERW